MASEDQEILAKIGQLSGLLNRHKNQQESANTYSSLHTQSGTQSNSRNGAPPPNTAWTRGRGTYSRGPMRGARQPTIHRNKTLVLNNSVPAQMTTEEALNGPGANSHKNVRLSNPNIAPQTAPAWVTKTDRHLQLINPAIFEKQSQDRARAIENSRKLKLKQRDERERTKFGKHLQRLAYETPYNRAQRTHTDEVAANYEIIVNDVRFRVAKSGSKLVKVPGDDNFAKATPKTAVVGGVKFYRSKNGNMYRSGIVKAQRRSGGVRKIDEPCQTFITTGSCSKGPNCRYIHDPAKVAICRDFLQKGSCQAGDSCDLSHELTPERTPTCLHFAKGNCSNPNCRYSHIRVSPSALVCRSFGIYGYCKKGADCTERHVHECPDFSNTGLCNNKRCKLPHREKASVIRRNAARGSAAAEDGSSDVSSDEDQDQIDSDDVDSDDLDEEYFGGDDSISQGDIQMQQDFVQLR